MRLLDLSVVIENTPAEPMTVKRKRLDYYGGAKQFCRRVAWNSRLPFKKRVLQLCHYLFKRKRLTPADFPGKAFLSLDIVTMPTHMGTHVDAPFHYGPRHDGEEARTIDELPLEWFYKPGVCLDLTHKKPGEYIGKDDIVAALACIDYQLQPLDIVLIHTGVAKLWGTAAYFHQAPGMSREATEWLVAKGIKVIGTDTYGFDRPFSVMLEAFWQTGDHAHLWPAHFYGREQEYVQIERLTQLDQLPATGFELACFPLRMKGMDASWVRAVAIIKD